jgi:branched-chain amino acid transport system permease protein
MVFVQIVVSGLLLGGVYALFSSGLTLVWGMMNVVNFAHGDFVMLGMYVAFLVVTWLHAGMPVFGSAAALSLFLLGVLVYLFLIRHVLRGPVLAQILSTFGLALLLRYSAFWIFSANFVTLPESALSGKLIVGGIVIGVAQLVAGVAGLALTVAMHVLLTRTRIGSQILAVAEDRSAAMLVGIRPDRMQALAWGIASATAGIAGALIATFYYIAPTVGATLVLIAFVVVSFGGFGSVPGALLGGLIIGLVQGLSAFYIGVMYQDVIVYAMFVLILWVRPQGLMGKAL